MASEVAAEDVTIWNIASNLCSSCLDGNYEDCYCDDHERLEKDLSCDSLNEDNDDDDDDDDGDGDGDDEANDDGSDGEDAVAKPIPKRNSLYDVYISDDEFHENEDEGIPLPPSTTDWDSIDSVLEKELVDPGDVDDGGLSKRLSHISHNVNMQMVFVESEESDKASDPDVEVYYDENMDDGTKHRSGSLDDLSYTDRNIDSRDSGYLTTDVSDANFEKVTDGRRRAGDNEPVEDSARVLASLKLHQDLEEKLNVESENQKQQEGEFIDEVHQKNVDELRTMKEFLELHIAKINYELLEQLEIRDYLYSTHESLLMDADDLSKSNAEGGETTAVAAAPVAADATAAAVPTNPKQGGEGSSKPPDPTPPAEELANNRSHASKRRSFWWR